jgi:hypothetical protein
MVSAICRLDFLSFDEPPLIKFNFFRMASRTPTFATPRLLGHSSRHTTRRGRWKNNLVRIAPLQWPSV